MSSLPQQIHDIRKPLNTISMQAELIKMLVETSEVSPQVEAAANKIIQNSKQCSELLQALYENTDAPSPNNTLNNDCKHP